MSRVILGSLARIADFHREPYEICEIGRSHWTSGDYVIGEVRGDRTELYRVECTDGGMIPVDDDDRIIGAFGYRAATLEGAGSHDAIEDDRMHALTSAGLFGRFTSYSRLLPPPLKLRYVGHIMRNGTKVCMRDFAIRSDPAILEAPVILLAGKLLRLDLAEIVEASAYAASSGLTVNAGHGLTCANVGPVAAIDVMEELNIGHSIVCRAVMIGMRAAVVEMLEACRAARAGGSGE